MNYPEAIQFLYGLQMFGANLGLERAEKLATLAGHPEKKLRFIHVAGTNGKGSTCAMLESIYRAAGLRVGFFTSPHLVSFRERIQISRQLISENEIVRLVSEIQPLLQNFPAENHPTMFEVVTVMALKFFAEQNCDLVIWETGLGGRLDATNIVTPLASVITNIAFDHTQWLGDTLAKIAAEKAGIIKNGIPVVTAVENPEALAVIENVAREKNANLTIVGQASCLSDERASRPQKINAGGTPATWTGKMPVPLLGEHQKQNAALALATVEVLQKQIPVSTKQIETGLQTVNWPGRLQLVEKAGGQKILLDGAHNVAGAEVLRRAILDLRKNCRLQGGSTLILGILQDKNWRAICEILMPIAGKIFIVPVANSRTTNPADLAEVCRKINSTAQISVCDSLSEALKKTGAIKNSFSEKTQNENFVVVTGSLYLIGEALELLGLSPASAGERGLNEWTKPVG